MKNIKYIYDKDVYENNIVLYMYEVLKNKEESRKKKLSYISLCGYFI